MKLSVLCPSFRKSSLDQRFAEQVRSYKFKSQVEFLMLNDNGIYTTGKKMQMLYNISQGEYVMYVADDDIVSPRLLPLVLDELHRKPAPEGIGFKMQMCAQVHYHDQICEVGRFFDGESGGNQWQWHPLCVTHRALLGGVKWPDKNIGEDRLLANQIAPIMDFDRWKFIDTVLYYGFPQEGHRWQGTQL